jgi:DNA-binding response OmpR family regulator
MKTKILVADDEKRMRILISSFLKNADYEVIEASDGSEAINLFMENQDIKLVILDVMMPIYNGFEVCEELKRISNTPIIMLTAKTAENDELTGFKVGADEYIKKPFSPSILVARVNALLKRCYSDTSVLQKGNLFIDFDCHIVRCHDTIINLSLTEYKLLLYLIENEGLVVDRNTLLNNVWGYDYQGTDRTVDTHIKRLRDKLLEGSIYVNTIRGYGYKFEVVL